MIPELIKALHVACGGRHERSRYLNGRADRNLSNAHPLTMPSSAGLVGMTDHVFFRFVYLLMWLRGDVDDPTT